MSDSITISGFTWQETRPGRWKLDAVSTAALGPWTIYDMGTGWVGPIGPEQPTLAKMAEYGAVRLTACAQTQRAQAAAKLEALRKLSGLPAPLHIFQLDRAPGRRFNYTEDVNNSFLVIAADRTEARKVAADKAMDEGRDCWLRPSMSACTHIGQADDRFKRARVLHQDATYA